MSKINLWSRLGLSGRILAVFLSLSVASLAIVGYLSFKNVMDMGQYALKTSISLGGSAIQDSTDALNKLGEETIRQKALDVARQVELYLLVHPNLTPDGFNADKELRDIAIQAVGKTGYTAVVDSSRFSILLHQFPEQEGKDLTSLKSMLPSFWAVIEPSAGGNTSSGYYDWKEADGSTRQKYAFIAPIGSSTATGLTLWATTYIDEFSQPADLTRSKINEATAGANIHIMEQLARMQTIFFIIFLAILATVSILAFMLSRAITRPILRVTQAARVIEGGELGEEEIASLSRSTGNDEVSVLSRVFAKMAAGVKARETKLKKQVEELKIEIDHSKKARQVAEITDTDYFQTLKQKAKELRDKKEKEESS